MKISRGEGRGRGGVSEESMPLIKMADLAIMEEEAIHEGLDQRFGGASTGFGKWLKKGGHKQEASTREDMEPSEIRRTRKNSDETGFATFKRQADSRNNDDNNELHSEDGEPGFGETFHGDPEDGQTPEQYDMNKAGSGGNMIAGSMEEEGRFQKPDHRVNPTVQKRKWNTPSMEDTAEIDDELNFDGEELTHKQVPPTSAPVSKKADDPFSMTPLQNEVVDQRPKKDVFDDIDDLMPDETADENLPGDGANRGQGFESDVVDPIGDDFMFKEDDGSWPVPGIDSKYPDKKVRVTDITGAYKFVTKMGRTLTGRILKSAEDHYIVMGTMPGEREARKMRVDKNIIESMKPLGARQVEQKSKMGSIYDRLAINEKTSENQYRRTEAKQVNAFEKVSTEELLEKVESEDQDNQTRYAIERELDRRLGGEKTADSNILGKYFGLKKKSTDSMSEDNRALHDTSKGDGELFGDDKALKDQLKEHETKVRKTVGEIKIAMAKSELAEKAGNLVLAEQHIAIADTLTVELRKLQANTPKITKKAEVMGFATESAEDEEFFND